MALRVGDTAPAFEGPDQHGDTKRLSDYAGKRIVVYFYPRDDTPVCTVEACAFRDDIDAFTALDVPVIGISADSVGSHKRFAERHRLDFTLISDPERQAIEAYDAKGLLGRTSRVTYLIGPDGKIEGVYKKELSGKGHVEWAKAQLAQLA